MSVSGKKVGDELIGEFVQACNDIGSYQQPKVDEFQPNPTRLALSFFPLEELNKINSGKVKVYTETNYNDDSSPGNVKNLESSNQSKHK